MDVLGGGYREVDDRLVVAPTSSFGSRASRISRIVELTCSTWHIWAWCREGCLLSCAVRSRCGTDAAFEDILQ